MQPEWSPEKRLEYRNDKAPPVLKLLEDKLLLIQTDPTVLPSTPLAVATNYLLNELEALKNYLLNADYNE
jgi:hypothetical protein